MNNAKNWTLLLTTDLILSFVQTIETYQIRWTIEVLFKECKQYLQPGGSQNTDFDGQIADTHISFGYPYNANFAEKIRSLRDHGYTL